MTLYCLIHGNVLQHDSRSGFDLCAECETEAEFDELIAVLSAVEDAAKDEHETFWQWLGRTEGRV